MFEFLSIPKTANVFAVAILTVILCGCGESVPPPPTERAELVARFFSSISNKDVKAAMRQGIKLHSLDKHNENIIRLVEIQQCNAYISSAQKLINAGNISGAIDVLRQGVKQHPDNVTLREMLPRVRQLRNAVKLLNSMKKASSSIAMRSALTAAKIGLAANSTPTLQKYFEEYERKITATEIQEKALAEAKAKAEQERIAKEKAKAEAKLEAEKKAAQEKLEPEKSAPVSPIAPAEPQLAPAAK